MTTDGKVSVEVDRAVPGSATTRQLTDARLQDLRSALDAVEFEDLRDSYRPETCMDCFVETITYRGTR